MSLQSKRIVRYQFFKDKIENLLVCLEAHHIFGAGATFRLVLLKRVAIHSMYVCYRFSLVVTTLEKIPFRLCSLARMPTGPTPVTMWQTPPAKLLVSALVQDASC